MEFMDWPEEAQLCVINATDVAESMLSLPLIRWARVDKKNFFSTLQPLSITLPNI